jgi:hypothetical protein
MKNLARLTLFFSLNFILIFLAAVLLGFISSWIEIAKIIPAGAIPAENAAELAWKALPITFYLTILVTLSYSARRKILILTSIAGIIVLGLIFTVGFSEGIHHVEAIKPALKPGPPINARPGLILSRAENAIILLKESSEAQGPRVVSFPERPLLYQEIPLGPNNTILGLPALPLGGDAPWIVQSMGIDFTLTAAELRNRLDQGFIPFIVYAFSLILFLGSLRFILELSQWPLANLFLGALVFRGILALEVFLNSREVNTLIGSFLSGRAPAMMITPLVFCALGILIILYTLLASIARAAGAKARKVEDD